MITKSGQEPVVVWRDPDLGNVGRIMALLWRVQPDLPVKIRP